MEWQMELCLQAEDAPQALTTMRMFGIKFAQRRQNSPEVRNAFAALKSMDDWNAEVDSWIRSLVEHRASYGHGAYDHGAHGHVPHPGGHYGHGDPYAGHGSTPQPCL